MATEPTQHAKVVDALGRGVAALSVHLDATKELAKGYVERRDEGSVASGDEVTSEAT